MANTSKQIKDFVKSSLHQYYQKFQVKMDDNVDFSINGPIKIDHSGNVYIKGVGGYNGNGNIKNAKSVATEIANAGGGSEADTLITIEFGDFNINKGELQRIGKCEIDIDKTYYWILPEKDKNNIWINPDLPLFTDYPRKENFGLYNEIYANVTVKTMKYPILFNGAKALIRTYSEYSGDEPKTGQRDVIIRFSEHEYAEEKADVMYNYTLVLSKKFKSNKEFAYTYEECIENDAALWSATFYCVTEKFSTE